MLKVFQASNTIKKHVLFVCVYHKEEIQYRDFLLVLTAYPRRDEWNMFSCNCSASSKNWKYCSRIQASHLKWCVSAQLTSLFLILAIKNWHWNCNVPWHLLPWQHNAKELSLWRQVYRGSTKQRRQTFPLGACAVSPDIRSQPPCECSSSCEYHSPWY